MPHEGVAARTAALALPGDLQRAHDLHLGEVGDRGPGEIPPCAAVGGRVDDDGDARFGQQPGHPPERPVHDVALGVGVARLRCQGLSDLVELEDAHGIAARSQLLAGRACTRRFAAAGNARDPDSPAHDDQPSVLRLIVIAADRWWRLGTRHLRPHQPRMSQQFPRRAGSMDGSRASSSAGAPARRSRWRRRR